MATAYGCAGYHPAGSARASGNYARNASGKNEVGVGAVHLGQEFVDHLHRDVAPATVSAGPRSSCTFVEQVISGATRWAAPTGATIRSGARRSRFQIGAANAEAHHHELVDAQVIHQAEMVIGVRIHGRSISSGPEGGAIGVAQV